MMTCWIKKKKSSKNEEKENLGRIEYDRFTSDITDDDEEIKSSPFVKKFICEQHSQLSQRPLIRSSSHASQVDLEKVRFDASAIFPPIYALFVKAIC